MKFFLLQHGHSYSKEEDPECSLTPQGIALSKTIAQALANKNLAIKQIYHSGKKRAQETAEIFAQALALESEVSIIEGIKPMDDVQLFAPSIQADTLIVGHLPFLQKLTNYLVTANESIDVVEFHNAHVVCIEQSTPQAPCEVKWVMGEDD